MNKTLLILVLMVCAIGLFAFYSVHRVMADSAQQKSAGDTVQDLIARVSRLESQVAALQAQTKELASKSSSRVLTIPETFSFKGNKMPPGAKEREINGLKFWIIPIKDDQ